MKKDMPIVVKPSTSPFLLAFIIIAAIDGILAIVDAQKHKKTSVPLLKCLSHCTKVSVMHQKFGTLS